MSAFDWLMQNVSIYRAWQAPFVGQKFAPVLRHNELGRTRSVLDLGCGPGINAHHFRGSQYLGIDWNPAYVDYARRRHRGEFAVADVRHEQITEGRRFDFILANSFFHHIDDEDASRLMVKMAGLLAPDGCVHIIDMVLPPGRGVAYYLATHDRGAHPRGHLRWEQMLREAFEPVAVEPYQLTGFSVPLWHMVYFKGRARS